MRRLLLLTRHADSDWDGNPESDHDRILSPRGERQAQALPKLLDAEQLAPDIVVSSSATRAFSTANAVANNLAKPVSVQRHQALYQGGMAALCAAVEPLADDLGAVMVVGHNPTISALATRLSGREIRMRPATCVVLEGHAASWEEALDGGWLLLAIKRPVDGQSGGM